MMSRTKPIIKKREKKSPKIIIYISILKYVVKLNIVILESSLSIQSFDNRPVHFHVRYQSVISLIFFPFIFKNKISF